MSVLVVCVDAAEPALVADLVEAGRLPAIARVAGEGWMRDFASTAADLGSGAVWPTFMAGAPPAEHGDYYHPGQWSPSAMAAVPWVQTGVRPWWHALAERGTRVLELDVPLAPRCALPALAQVSEWGAHDVTHGRMATAPAGLAALLTERHPFDGEPVPSHDAPSRRQLDGALRRAHDGVRMRGALGARLLARERPELALVAFPEWHHVAHLLWPRAGDGSPADSPLAGLLIEIDAQVARLRGALPGAAVAVLSLHGMRASNGVTQALPALLEHGGYQRRAPGAAGLRARAAAAAKAALPEPARRLWRRRAPAGLARRVAGASLLAGIDWQRTTAFALPSDQHGWVRINLAGRERLGVVDPAGYDALRDQLADRIAAATAHGAPLAERVVRPAPGGPHAALPDLVVHWADAALADPLAIDGIPGRLRPDARRLTGQHAPRGFVAAAGIAAPDGELDVPALGGVLAPAAL